jgi:CRP-like cAMP-binding protein
MASPIAKPEKSLLRYSLQASLRKLAAARPLAPSPADIEHFLSMCHRRRYPSQGDDHPPGRHGQHLYYIIEGSLAVMSEDDEGRELVLGYINAGDFIGEMGMFMEPEQREVLLRSRTALRTGRDRLRAPAPVVRRSAGRRVPAHPLLDRLAAHQAPAADQPQGRAWLSWMSPAASRAPWSTCAKNRMR